jgi:hypothetical protein
MKNIHRFIAAITLVLIAILFFSFKMTPSAKTYQHIMIYAEHYDCDNVLVSIDGKEYKKMKLTRQIQGPWDFNPIINLIHQYENEGYELMSAQCTGSPSFFHLRKVYE